MQKRRWRAWVQAAFIGAAASAAGGEEEGSRWLEAFAPLPELPALEEGGAEAARVALGRQLFHDPRLSAGGAVSCRSCHDLARFGMDGLAAPRAAPGAVAVRNTPSVFNASLQFAQYWDARVTDLEAQARRALVAPDEMGWPDEEGAVEVLRGIPGYVTAFARAFPGEDEPVRAETLGRALAAFERRLLTPSRFDGYLRGDEAALRPSERRGLEAFVSAGCAACHPGPLLGGGFVHKLGVVRPWPGAKDPGREAVTGRAEDRYWFKVPPLRNVRETAPYLHDGSVPDLATVVRKMAEHQLGARLSTREVAVIVEFLGSLTGEPPAAWSKPPELPGGGVASPPASPGSPGPSGDPAP